jgi:regulation of enolase protein 1 (concanavalin A-like superfamily)
VVLGDPYTSYGRLMQPCWLRLARAGDRFAASISPDGQHWTVAGETTASLPRSLFVGMRVSSGISGVSTTATFDHLSVGSVGSDKQQ